jgi:hypothetical protein
MQNVRLVQEIETSATPGGVMDELVVQLSPL